MEIIQLPGYTEHEKYNIAQDFLIPKQIRMNGLEGYDVQFSKNTVYEIIQKYTREAGVRNLEREIAAICRKIAREALKNGQEKTYRVSQSAVQKYLGPPRFRHGQIEARDQIGIVTGLAWTHAGGDLLCVETLVMPGKGDLIITGKLGEVMKESAQAAVSYVRSRAERLGLDPRFHRKTDLHIHVPEGAIPKDGPSAGISMCTSIVSALTRRPVHRDIAMTGEITLRGRVLPIGGLKEKILAAHRAGIRKVLIPADNEKDLKDIPASIAKQLEIVPVEHMDEVMTHALVLADGDTLFQGSDIYFDVSADKQPDSRTAIN
jgi:ATP-dependent Lon protease